MKTVTLKIPDNLDTKIRRAIARRKETFSHLARRALARVVRFVVRDLLGDARPRHTAAIVIVCFPFVSNTNAS